MTRGFLVSEALIGDRRVGPKLDASTVDYLRESPTRFGLEN